MESFDKAEVMKKLTKARKSLLKKTPFYGMLLMNMRFMLAPCKTACTDMCRIFWDGAFVMRLKQPEIEFVLLHEIMHCALGHCIRGRGCIPNLYNIAADIVVNSNILKNLGIKEMSVDKVSVMHLAPDGREGYFYNVEQVYAQLLKTYESLMDDVEKLCLQLESDYGVCIDRHKLWESIPLNSSLPDEWKARMKEAARLASGLCELPPEARELLDELDYKTQVDWKTVLHEFIQLAAKDYDFTFTPVDRRFSDNEVLLPSFFEMEGASVEQLWFLVDTSASIDDETLTAVLEEIRSAIEQFTSFSALLSYFDTSVTTPQPFEEAEDLTDIQPQGGGGTSFHCIFRYMQTEMEDKLPRAVIIITDGYAHYPEEAAAMDVPVLWILVNRDKDAPWGKTVHITIR